MVFNSEKRTTVEECFVDAIRKILESLQAQKNKLFDLYFETKEAAGKVNHWLRTNSPTSNLMKASEKNGRGASFLVLQPHLSRLLESY
jgi:hypothetical protein